MASGIFSYSTWNCLGPFLRRKCKHYRDSSHRYPCKLCTGIRRPGLFEDNLEVDLDFGSGHSTLPGNCLSDCLHDFVRQGQVEAGTVGDCHPAVLDQFADQIKGKNCVCLISGGNNDITRTAEIKERALLHANLKHYFIIKFPQRAGALREFVAEILGPTDDITHFEYTKKTNRENGAAVVGLELKSPEDLEPLITKMKLHLKL